LFEIALDLDLDRARRLGSRVQGHSEALGDQALAHAFDRPHADAEGIHDVRVGVFWAQGGIRQQEDAGMR
jgi:hypothetical protein